MPPLLPKTQILVSFSGLASPTFNPPVGEIGSGGWQLKSTANSFPDGGTRSGKLKDDYINSDPTRALLWLWDDLAGSGKVYLNVILRTDPTGFYKYHTLADYERETKKAVISLKLTTTNGLISSEQTRMFIDVDETAGISNIVLRAENAGSLFDNISADEDLDVTIEFRGRRGKKPRAYTPAVSLRGNMQHGAMRRQRTRQL